MESVDHRQSRARTESTDDDKHKVWHQFLQCYLVATTPVLYRTVEYGILLVEVQWWAKLLHASLCILL